MAISSPEEWPLQQRDCHASLAMTVRAKPGTHEAAEARAAELEAELRRLRGDAN